VSQDAQGASVIVQYRFDAEAGTLSKVNTTAVPDPNTKIKAQAVYLQFGPEGHYAYAFDRKSNVIYQYSVDKETGKLAALKPAMLVTCSVVRSLVFDPDLATPYAYAAASNRANLTLKPNNPKLCQKLMSNPYELHVDQFLMDAKTGQLSSFISKS
jgi:6-phosphogluconolactonase (cycloisomerase 2 family)